ncbi:MAG: NUDIX domain-containing protein [Casimicrobiaceae bacterium]
MPMSTYVRDLRAKIGTDLLEVPTVSVIVIDASERVLLVRHVEGNLWTTPGGMIEPLEVPADAAVRETWEETGLHVELTRLLGVFGGPLYRARYSNGDEIAFVSTVFLARPIGGTLKPDGEETLETRYFAQAEVASLAMKPHVPPVLAIAFSATPHTHFEPPTWTP